MYYSPSISPSPLLLLEELPYLNMPLHTIVKLTPVAYGELVCESRMSEYVEKVAVSHDVIASMIQEYVLQCALLFSILLPT